MPVYVVVGTPQADGRITDIRMVPPPGGNTVGQVLIWNAERQEPEWRLLSDFIIVTPPTTKTYLPLTAAGGKWLVDNQGRRLSALRPAA
jgi:hypothetical protein